MAATMRRARIQAALLAFTDACYHPEPRRPGSGSSCNRSCVGGRSRSALHGVSPPGGPRRSPRSSSGGRASLGCEFQVWVGVAEHVLPIAPIEGVVDRADHVHVLLRHRLLRQTGGFEVFVRVRETAPMHDLAISIRPELPELP